jgi:hypothetical protein
MSAWRQPSPGGSRGAELAANAGCAYLFWLSFSAGARRCRQWLAALAAAAAVYPAINANAMSVVNITAENTIQYPVFYCGVWLNSADYLACQLSGSTLSNGNP